MRRPRHLSDDERALWERVAERATPLSPKIEEKLPTLAMAPAPKPKSKIQQFQVGERTLFPVMQTAPKPRPLNMDHKSFVKMKRGKLSPEAKIDLHGMTLAQAHPALMSFVLGSHSLGHRLVLVITGKGREADALGTLSTHRGILRRQVPQWLAISPLSRVVLQVSPAHLKHGGDGALYVYLKRDR